MRNGLSSVSDAIWKVTAGVQTHHKLDGIGFLPLARLTRVFHVKRQSSEFNDNVYDGF